jgi:hypothetical protein
MSPIQNIKREIFFHDDFLSVATYTSGSSWQPTLTSSSSISNVDATIADKNIGEVALAASSNSRSAMLRQATRSHIIGVGRFELDTRIKVNMVVTWSQMYAVRIGLMDSTAVSQPTDGIYFEYNQALYGGSFPGTFYIVCRNSGTSTAVNTNVYLSANNYYNLNYVVNADGTSVTFYIDSTTVGTITTNIPTAALTASIGIASTSGYNSKVLYVDWFAYQYLIDRQ